MYELWIPLHRILLSCFMQNYSSLSFYISLCMSCLSHIHYTYTCLFKRDFECLDNMDWVSYCSQCHSTPYVERLNKCIVEKECFQATTGYLCSLDSKVNKVLFWFYFFGARKANCKLEEYESSLQVTINSVAKIIMC